MIPDSTTTSPSGSPWSLVDVCGVRLQVPQSWHVERPLSGDPAVLLNGPDTQGSGFQPTIVVRLSSGPAHPGISPLSSWSLASLCVVGGPWRRSVLRCSAVRRTPRSVPAIPGSYRSLGVPRRPGSRGATRLSRGNHLNDSAGGDSSPGPGTGTDCLSSGLHAPADVTTPDCCDPPSSLSPCPRPGSESYFWRSPGGHPSNGDGPGQRFLALRPQSFHDFPETAAVSRREWHRTPCCAVT